MSKRIILWDNLKFFLILCVVIGHFIDANTDDLPFYQSIFLFIYAFHMPLFIFIAGLFYKEDKVFKNFLSYISIYFLLKSSIYLTQYFFNLSPTFSFFEESGVPWYMFVLAFYYLVTYILKSVNQKAILFLSVMIALIVGYFDEINDFFMLSRFFVFYPFFILGVMLNPEDILSLSQKKILKITSITIMTIWIICCFFLLDYIYPLRFLFTARHPYSTTVFENYGSFFRFICYGISLLVGYSVVILIPKKEIKVISKCGQKTLQIFFWQSIFIRIFNYSGFSELFFSCFLGETLWIIFAILCTLFLSLKIFSFPTTQIMNLFKKNKIKI